MNKKKKVLFVATVVKKHINVFHLPYLQWFQEQGYETHVCARNDFEGEECIIPYCDVYYDIPFERSPIHKNNVKAYKQLKGIIDKNEYGIIHCHTPVAAMLTRLAAIKTRKTGTKIIYTAHGFHFYKGSPLLNWILYYPAEKLCSYFTDVLITINREDYKFAKKKMKCKKTYYVPGVGVDTCSFNKIELDIQSKKREIGLLDNQIMILSIGELNKNKNHEIIIRALASLSNPNIYYYIAGEGELEQHLESTAKSLGIEEQVRLLRYRKDIAELCKITDIFCFPSYREGLSVALMEAMATGLPVICSKIRGNLDLIQEEKGGYLCNSNSIREFKIAINKLIKDKNLRTKMGKYNKNFIQQFDTQIIVKKMKKLYEEVLNE